MQDKLQALLLLLIISAFSVTNAVSIEDNSERIQETRCNFIDRTSVVREMQNVKCKPRQTHVVIEVAKPELIVIPPAVMVKRCSGYCARHTSCLPIQKRMVTKQVRYRNIIELRGNEMCGTVEVEEHVKCKCECAIKENDCSEQQIYDEHNCLCKCDDTMETMEECKVRKGWRWDEEKCVCVT